jgi:hypothetical protein
MPALIGIKAVSRGGMRLGIDSGGIHALTSGCAQEAKQNFQGFSLALPFRLAELRGLLLANHKPAGGHTGDLCFANETDHGIFVLHVPRLPPIRKSTNGTDYP